jgi:hypothetical protein
MRAASSEGVEGEGEGKEGIEGEPEDGEGEEGKEAALAVLVAVMVLIVVSTGLSHVVTPVAAL